MAEEYDVQAIMNALREKEEMDPDQHDGSYELMRETIRAYGKLDDFSIIPESVKFMIFDNQLA